MRTSAWLLALLVTAPALGAQPWRYTDDQGQVHWTNDIYQLPKRQREAVQAKRKARAEAQAEARAAQQPKSGEAPTAGTDAPRQDAEQPPAAALMRGVFTAPPTMRSAPKPLARGSRKATKRGGVDWGQRIRDAEARLQGAKTDLARGKEALVKARRQALIVPSGRAFAQRTMAEKQVARLEGLVGEARSALLRIRDAAPR